MVAAAGETEWRYVFVLAAMAAVAGCCGKCGWRRSPAPGPAADGVGCSTNSGKSSGKRQIRRLRGGDERSGGANGGEPELARLAAQTAAANIS